MIKSIKIKNFKGLNDCNINDLRRINLLGGKNNAGKTTVLEALFMFYDRLNPNMLLRQYNWRGVNELALSPETIFAPIFTNFDLTQTIQIEVTNDRSLLENMTIKYKDNDNSSITLKSNDGQIRTDEPVIGSSKLEFIIKNSSYKEQKINLILNNAGMQLDAQNVRNPEVNAIFIASKGHLHPSENAIRYGDLDVKGQANEIINFLTLIEPRLKSLSSVTHTNNTSMLYADIGVGPKVPISYMGDGISRVLTILLSIATNKNGMIFIDEIENGIHYSILSKVWEIISKAAVEYNCQIFATTHSYECLSAAVLGIEEENRESFKYFRLERSNKEEKISSKSYNYEVLKTAIDKGWEVR